MTELTSTTLSSTAQLERLRRVASNLRWSWLRPSAELLASLPGAQAEIHRLNREGYDLSRYESHVQAHLKPFPISFDEIPPLSDDARLDRIWRFIAIVFMAHAGLIEIRQESHAIMVIQREAD